MVTCYNCGKQVSDETLICPECGALVRRYESRPRQEAEPERKSTPWGWQGQQNQQPQQQSWQQPQQPQQPWQAGQNVPPYQNTYQPRTRNGQFRFSTGFSTWIWICIAGLTLMASCLILCGVVLTGDTEFTQLYMDIFRQQGMDLENIAGGVQLAASVLYINAGGCLLMVLLNLVLFFTRSRRAALVNLIGCIVLTVVMVLLVSLNLVCIMIMVAGMVNNLLLRRQIPYMKR